MATILNKVGSGLAEFDLFAQPVRLTYKGKIAFGTAFGGLASLIIVLALIFGFFFQLYEVYFYPNFQNYPPTYDYQWQQGILIDPSTGSTVAMAVAQPPEDVQVNFFAAVLNETTGTYKLTRIPAVYCEDFYADQIAKEKRNGNDDKQSFSWMFETLTGYEPYVCPDVSEFKLSEFRSFQTSLVPCSLSTNAVYAEGTVCSTKKIDKVKANVNFVSTNFASDLYFTDNVLQLYNQEHLVKFDPTENSATLSASVKTTSTNKFYRNFFWPYSPPDIAQTIAIKLESDSEMQPAQEKLYLNIHLVLPQTFYSTTKQWTRVSLLDYIANFSSLALSIIKGSAFVLAGFQSYSQTSTMLSALYGQVGNHVDTDPSQLESLSKKQSVSVFEKRVRGYRQLVSSGYCAHLLYMLLTKLCCCCSETAFIRTRSQKYQSYEEARKRLDHEHDILKWILLNRLARLLHRSTFQPRQRHAVNFTKPYVIDTEAPEWRAPAPFDPKLAADEVLAGFDPDEDHIDLKLLLEVTGMNPVDLPLNETAYVGNETRNEFLGISSPLLRNESNSSDPDGGGIGDPRVSSKVDESFGI